MYRTSSQVLTQQNSFFKDWSIALVQTRCPGPRSQTPSINQLRIYHIFLMVNDISRIRLPISQLSLRTRHLSNSRRENKVELVPWFDVVLGRAHGLGSLRQPMSKLQSSRRTCCEEDITSAQSESSGRILHAFTNDSIPG